MRAGFGCFVVVLGCAVLAPAGAHASTVGIDAEDVVRFAAAPGEVNTVSAPFDFPYTEFVVTDATAPLTAGPGCVQRGAHQAVCEFRGQFAARLGDRDDVLDGAPFDAYADIYGGPGNDRITANTNILSVYGEAGNDELVASANGFAHADGGPGDDRIASPGEGIVAGGGAGDDTMTAAAGSLEGGPGDDALSASGAGGGDYGGVRLIGGDGNDRLLGGPDTDVLDGGAANDLLDGSTGGDSLAGGPGIDVASYVARTAPLTLRIGAPGGQGEAGEDDVIGADVEQLRGGSAADLLVGGPGANRLEGGPGPDRLVGGAGDDTLLGGEGDDLLDGSSTAADGADYVAGGPGLDTVSYAGRADGPVVTSLGTGTRDDGAPGERDWVLGDVEQLIGTRFADVLAGTSGPNGIRGGAGDDAISGGDGADTLAGEAGADRVSGGPGADAIRVEGDRTADRVDCGQNGGTAPQTVLDTVTFDRLLDTVARCEILQPR